LVLATESGSAFAEHFGFKQIWADRAIETFSLGITIGAGIWAYGRFKNYFLTKTLLRRERADSAVNIVTSVLRQE
jgi:hypothetical protein